MDVNSVRPQIEALIAQFAWDIDHQGGEGVPALFVPDGTYSLRGLGTLTGQAEIADFYRMRLAGGPRTSRHLFSNLHLRSVSPDRAMGTCVLQLHAADGAGPHPLSPVMIADYHDEYARTADGRWLFASREVAVVFGQTPGVAAED